MVARAGGKEQGALGELLRLAWPVVLARLGIMTMGLTDSIVVGRHSSTQLAYLQLGWSPTGAVLTTAIGLLIGVQVMTARHVGEGRSHNAGAVLRRGLVYALLIGAFSATLLYFGGPPFLRTLDIAPALVESSGRVVQVLALSLPVYAVCCVCTFWLEALAKPIPGMLAMATANIVNLVLNLWLVPGGSNFPVEGAVAAAWATFAARGTLMIMLLVYIACWSGARRYGVFGASRDDAADAREQRRIGYGAGASQFVEASAFSGMTVIAGELGGLDVAAWAIAFNLAGLIFMGPLGLSSATAVLVGRAYGARDDKGVLRNGLLGIAVCVALTGVICLVVWVGTESIAHAYTKDAMLVARAAPILALSCLFFVADGVQVVAAQALRARSDVWVPTTTHVISYALVMLPLGYALALPIGLGLAGIVWAVIIASLLAAGFLLGRFLWLARPVAPAGRPGRSAELMPGGCDE